jgi:hypothetical protein
MHQYTQITSRILFTIQGKIVINFFTDKGERHFRAHPDFDAINVVVEVRRVRIIQRGTDVIWLIQSEKSECTARGFTYVPIGDQSLDDVSVTEILGGGANRIRAVIAR